jgi:hypothetical protein
MQVWQSKDCLLHCANNAASVQSNNCLHKAACIQEKLCNSSQQQQGQSWMQGSNQVRFTD